MSFGATTTADEILEGIDLTDKYAIVTGASGGSGGPGNEGYTDWAVDPEAAAKLWSLSEQLVGCLMCGPTSGRLLIRCGLVQRRCCHQQHDRDSSCQHRTGSEPTAGSLVTSSALRGLS